MSELRVLILSPHRDDAAFSCGLLMAGLERAGAVITVANVCTRSDYAPYLDIIDAVRAETVTAARAEEDRRFAQELAAIADVADTVRWIDMQWMDAPLRLGVATERVLQQRNAEPDGVVELAESMRALPDADLVLTPLALGSHVDHLLVRETARKAFAGRNIFYEDLPYACRMTSQQRDGAVRSIAGLQSWSPAAIEHVGSKRRLAMCYPSQIAPDVANEMENYATALGGRERFYGENSAMQMLDHALQSGQA